VLFSLPAFVRVFLNDMDFYTHVADKLIAGGLLYRDALDTKPPAIFLHYALVFRWFGPDSLAAVKIVTIAFVALTAAGVAALWRALMPRSGGGGAAAFLFVLASVCGWGEDFLSSNTEVLANLFLVWGVWAFAKDRFEGRPWWPALGGALMGIACLYRLQSAAALGACVLMALAGPVRVRLTRVASAAAGFAAMAVLFVAAWTTTGRAGDLVQWLQYGRYYLRSGEVYWPALLAQTGVVLVSQAAFLLLAAWQVRCIVGQRSFSRANVFLLLLLACSLAAAGAGVRFFAHYYIQALPFVVILATARVLEPASASRAPLAGVRGAAEAFRRRAPALIVAQAAIFAIVNAGFYFWTREPRNAYPDLVRFVQARTSRADRIFVWTPRTHILFAMDRVFATRFISNDFLVGRIYGTRHRLRSATADSARDAAVPELWPLLMHDLEAERPPLIIDDTPARSSFTIDHYPELAAFVARSYEPCQVVESFCVYVRRKP
jgi:hypothetical protein